MLAFITLTMMVTITPPVSAPWGDRKAAGAVGKHRVPEATLVRAKMYILVNSSANFSAIRSLSVQEGGNAERTSSPINQNSSSRLAATPGSLSRAGLALQCVDDSAEATGNKVVTVVRHRPRRSSIWLLKMYQKKKGKPYCYICRV